MKTVCRLCKALKATGFEVPSDVHPDLRDSFSRDPEICDACLATEAAPGSPPFIFLKTSMVAGFMIAIILSVFVAGMIVSFDVIDGPPRLIKGVQPYLAIVFTCFLGGMPLCSLLVYAGFQRWANKMERDERLTKPKAYKNETERLYLLSRWAELRGDAKLAKKLRRTVKRRGFDGTAE